MKKSRLRLLLLGLGGLGGLCILLTTVSALVNLGLPTHSQLTERLSDLEKARLAETIRLRQALGEAVWPGWGDLDIPIIVYNEEYAFLVGYTGGQPADGWLKVPQQELRGGPWQAVPSDTFEGQVYYRQPLTGPDATPENFTVRIGERWIATMETKEYMEVHFYEQFRQELPPPLQPVFPYRLIWGLLMGETDTYIGGLQHETFHAFQGSLVPERLADAENANRYERDYPWDDPTLAAGWQEELDLLVQAVRAPDDAEAAELAHQFLAARAQRRSAAGLSPALIDYERQREWLEGLAKYAELALGRLAGATPTDQPLPALSADTDFNRYTGREQYWWGQVDEVARTAGRPGEVRFYYSGMAQAALLDRLLPGWKAQALEPGVMLEDLLSQALASLNAGATLK